MKNGKMTAAVLAAAVAGLVSSAQAAPKNVILMIGDGMGFNHVQTTAVYDGVRPVYETFTTKVAMQTYSATGAAVVGGAAFNPASNFGDIAWSMRSGTYTDSASAATAMYTGVKNNDGVVNMTTANVPLTTYYEKAAMNGKAVGAVSTVELSHATPAAVYGHNVSRNNYAEIGTEGVYGGTGIANNAFYNTLNYNGNFKVLMGAGHGDYNDNGAFTPTADDKYAGGTTTWNDIKDGAAPNGWTFKETKAEFEAVANGTSNPSKLLGIAQANSTLQQGRGAGAVMNTNVPDLTTMTKAALNVLDNQAAGFSVMIEGGAIDWAGHANQTDRMIEETRDFNNAVQAVVNYLNANGGAGTNGNSFANTLLIVTADHETGGLWGAGTYTNNTGNGQFQTGDTFQGYQTITGTAGVLPSVQWASPNHTNTLVPLYAMGAGAEFFTDAANIVGTDGNLSSMYGSTVTAGFDGKYIDNTAIYHGMMTGVPEPTSLAAISVLGLLLGRRRRA